MNIDSRRPLDLFAESPEVVRAMRGDITLSISGLKSKKYEGSADSRRRRQAGRVKDEAERILLELALSTKPKPPKISTPPAKGRRFLAALAAVFGQKRETVEALVVSGGGENAAAVELLRRAKLELLKSV